MGLVMPNTILALETASTICGSAVISDGNCLSIIEKEANRKHAEILPKLIQQSLEEAKKKINDFDAIAVSIGPGSFTGLRIGLGMAKGLAYSHELPIIPVPTIASIALSLQSEFPKNGIVYSHGKRVFFQQFNWGNGFPVCHDTPVVGDIEEFIEKLGDNSFHWNCDEIIPDNLKLYKGIPSAEWVGKLGYYFSKKWLVETPHSLTPDYIAPFEINNTT